MMNILFRLWAFIVLMVFAGASQATLNFSKMAEVRQFIAEMHDQYGFSSTDLQQMFAEIEPLPAVIKAVQPPRNPAAHSWQSYRKNHVDEQRIRFGQRFWLEHAAALRAAHVQTGVPEEIIVAIIGIESIYGRHMGKFNTLAALSSLAFLYPERGQANWAQRKALFRHELMELLLLARKTQRDPAEFRGSYAGALGWPQFLPSSIRQYARDGDQDAQIDLMRSPNDAIASVANFLWQHGWEEGGPIVVMATVSGEQIEHLLAEGIRPNRLPTELFALGVSSPNAPNLPAALIDLVTPQQATEYRLGFQNFFVITRYNRSSFYAMAVYELAESLKQAKNAAPLSQAATSWVAPLAQQPVEVINRVAVEVNTDQASANMKESAKDDAKEGSVGLKVF